MLISVSRFSLSFLVSFDIWTTLTAAYDFFFYITCQQGAIGLSASKRNGIMIESCSMYMLPNGRRGRTLC